MPELVFEYDWTWLALGLFAVFVWWAIQRWLEWRKRRGSRDG